MNADEFTKILIHEAERKYDPAKRKEYYERTKKLKGRSRNPSKAQATFRAGERGSSAGPKNTSSRAASKEALKRVSTSLRKKADQIEKEIDDLVITPFGYLNGEKHKKLIAELSKTVEGYMKVEDIIWEMDYDDKKSDPSSSYSKTKETKSPNPFPTKTIDRSAETEAKGRAEWKRRTSK